MSYISLLRQRIKVIQTIRKTTSAMRLAARAIQARLRKKEVVFNTYVASIDRVYQQYESLLATTRQPEKAQSQLAPDTSPPRHYLLIIGSHKGLCGAFNERLFAFFNRSIEVTPEHSIISVGTQASQHLTAQKLQPLHQFDQFTSTTLVTIAQQLTQTMIAARRVNLTIVSNHPRTFFLQEPRQRDLLIDFTAFADTQSPEAQLRFLLSRLQLRGTLLKILYDSLVAEQAARFLSMDNATRNAEEILNQAKIDYNKLRQALVTRELLELSTATLPE